MSKRKRQNKRADAGTGGADGKKRRSRVLLFVELACLAVIVAAGVCLFQQLMPYYVADRDFQTVAQETDGDPQKAHEFNGDCIGWVTVRDTRIDYPVMYTPKDPEYYLHRNFQKEYSFAGTPFMGQGSDPGNEQANSQIIYAHHMRDGSMFGQLERFNDKGWAEAHAILYENSEGTTKYHAFAAMYVDLSGGSTPYEYWNRVGELSEEAFEQFVDDVSERSLYSTKYKAEYGRKIMMLSTCSYGTSEQRFVVFAVTSK